MASAIDIKKKVREIVDNKFLIDKVGNVPDIANSKLTFGNKGLQFEATVLYIDMRGSTKILNKHRRSVVSKIHMSYFHTIVSIADDMGGEVRSFNGDSMLVFFQGETRLLLSRAVMAAMKMNYMLKNREAGVNQLLSKYSKIDFGIGIDDGNILCTKIGKGWDSNTQDLIWIGNAVNKSVVLSDLCRSPNHIAISGYVYNNLLSWVKYKKLDIFGFEQKVNMWKRGDFYYNDLSDDYYYTNYYWPVM